MNILSEVTIRIKKRSFPSFIEELYKRDCTIQSLLLIDTHGDEDLCKFNIAYANEKVFQDFITIVSNAEEKYRVMSVLNTLESVIEGGMLSVGSKIAIENRSDYDTKVLGSYSLIMEKIELGNGMKFSGISRNFGFFSGIRPQKEGGIEQFLRAYNEAERDAVIMNRFTGLNVFPQVISMMHPEDIVKIMKRLERNFSALRILDIDESDLALYEQICLEMDIPVVSRAVDEVPIYILALIIKSMMKHHLKAPDTTIGFIGIDLSVVRLTRLLDKIGCYRVLGYDLSEKMMLSLESQGGLATTAENIFGNADISVVVKDNFAPDDIKTVRPGQFIISFISEDFLDRDVIVSRGVREFIQGDLIELSAMFPGILRGIIDSGLHFIEDAKVVDIAKNIVGMLGDNCRFPDVFGDIHDRVSSIMKTLKD